MSELKTLKELRGFWMPNQVKARKFRMVEESELKQEAIRWVKHIQNDIEQLQDIESKPQSPLQKVATRGLDEVLEGQIKVMTDFFNITEEDLK